VKTVNGMPFVTTAGKSIKLKDIVPMEGAVKGSDGGFQLSWYDLTKKGFRFVTWYEEIYEKDGETLVTDEGGWGEYELTQSYPDDIATIGWDVGAGFFITPVASTVDPAVHFINPFYTAK